jgi:hypothetical protein
MLMVKMGVSDHQQGAWAPTEEGRKELWRQPRTRRAQPAPASSIFTPGACGHAGEIHPWPRCAVGRASSTLGSGTWLCWRPMPPLRGGSHTAVCHHWLRLAAMRASAALSSSVWPWGRAPPLALPWMRSGNRVVVDRGRRKEKRERLIGRPHRSGIWSYFWCPPTK